MNRRNKICYLADKYTGEWIIERRRQEEKLSESQLLTCVCGRLATGLHESHCRKFQTQVDLMTMRVLEHLLLSSSDSAPIVERRGNEHRN